MINSSDEIKSRLNIADVLGEYIKLQPAGGNFKAKCPFHQEKTPSLMVSPDKQMWHCFGCGKGGDIFAFVMEMEGLSFPEAIRLLAPKAGVEITNYKGQDNSRRNRLLDVLVEAGLFYQKQLLAKNQLATAAQHYLKEERLLVDETIEYWQIGWAPNDWQMLSDHLQRQNYTENELLLAGLNSQAATGQRFYDRFRGRIMFPWHDVNGNLLGFSARVLPQLDDGKSGKYINSPQNLIYDKGKQLFGLWRAKTAIKEAGCAVVVEGQMDCIMAHQQGFKNVVATSGTALTEDHLKLLKRYTENLVLAFDMDQAGVSAADRAIALASQTSVNIRVLRLPEGKDPDEFLKKDKDAWPSLVAAAPSIMEYYFQLLRPQLISEKVEQRKAAAKRFLTLSSKLVDVVERDYWLKELAQILHIEVQLLYNSLMTIKQPDKQPAAKVGPAVQQSAKSGLADLFLAWLIKFPYLLDNTSQWLEPELLEATKAALIYKNLIVYYNKKHLTAGEAIDYTDFIAWWNQNDEPLADKLHDYLNSLFLLADKDLGAASVEQAMIELPKLVRTIQRDGLQSRLMAISRQIAELEKNSALSDSKRELEINILMGEAEELSQSLRNLDN
jgi:DNA primase